MTREEKLPYGEIVRATDETLGLARGEVSYTVTRGEQIVVRETILPSWQAFEERLARTIQNHIEH